MGNEPFCWFGMNFVQRKKIKKKKTQKSEVICCNCNRFNIVKMKVTTRKLVFTFYSVRSVRNIAYHTLDWKYRSEVK